MIEIRQLAQGDILRLTEVIRGYVSEARYEVARTETEDYRGQGIGRQLMDELAAKATAAGLRIIVCETQNTNVPAIRFYRRLGFAVEGIDVSYYSNEDLEPDRSVAIFMKRRLR